MRIFITSLLLSCVFCLFAQELKTPKELLEIMEKSEISYKLEITEAPFAVPDRSERLNSNNFYVVDSAESRIVREYFLAEEAEIHFDLGEKYFTDGRYSDARREYEKVLEISPMYYKVVPYIAQTYGREKNFDQAIIYYKKAIKLNRIDYLSHMLIADIYKLQENYQKAAYHITYAQILNRNNTRIQLWRNDIYTKAKLKPFDFNFNPQIKLSPDQDTLEVEIVATNTWMLYAICKSIWAYETGYAESQGKARDEFSLLEEKESIVCLLTSLASAKKKEKKKPEFVALQKALDAKMLEEFIIFEIWLPDYPWISYRFSENFLDSMVEYVMYLHGGKKQSSN